MSPLIKVKVKPRSRRSEIRRDSHGIVAWVNAAPENGKANHELIRLLADFFFVPQKEIRIKAGANSALKWIQIPDEINTLEPRGGNHGRNQQ